MLSRRAFMKWLSSFTAIPLAAAGTLPRCGKGKPVEAAPKAAAPGNRKGRAIILGFDGVEPAIVDAMLAAGQLPNLAKLRDTGCYQRLATTNPPQSPTAWSSFITCTNPGAHGIFDFVRRDPKTYHPSVWFGTTTSAILSADGSLDKPPEFVNSRKGTSFWEVADAQELRCKLLTVPYACPPDDLKSGQMLCGLDLPDIRGMQSTFFSLSDEYLEKVRGGVNIQLVFNNDVAETKIPGLLHPERKEFVEVPVRITRDTGAHTIVFEVQGQSHKVEQGKWSPWVEWSFEVTPKWLESSRSRTAQANSSGGVPTSPSTNRTVSSTVRGVLPPVNWRFCGDLWRFIQPVVLPPSGDSYKTRVNQCRMDSRQRHLPVRPARPNRRRRCRLGLFLCIGARRTPDAALC